MLDLVSSSPPASLPLFPDAPPRVERAVLGGFFELCVNPVSKITAIKEAPLYINKEFFREIAEWYDQAPTVGIDTDTLEAYSRLKIEFEDQLRVMRSLVQVESIQRLRWFPYVGSEALFRDIHDNRHIFRVVVATEGDQILSPEQIATARVVHDFWGHGFPRLSFSPENEERTLLIHRQMFSPLAFRAMKSIIRGQTAWSNFLPIHAELDFGKRPPAPWKSILLPDRFLED